MEVRTLARSLRSRPTASLLCAKQPTLIHGQFNFPRFASRSSKPPFPQGRRPSPLPSTKSSTNDKAPKPAPTATEAASPTSDFDQILNKLDLNSSASANAASSTTIANTPKSKHRPFNDPLSLSRAVGSATSREDFDSYRQPIRRVELKLGPALGRQVAIEPDRGIDLPLALKFLNSNISANGLRRQSHAQKFHVRRGQMVKNVRMARWRKLFKYSFGKTVERIQRMRAQGW